jgi:glycosyltransferase involved in cell wall biosynthesis
MPADTILHLIDTGGPGGAETVFMELVTGLRARGWDSVAVVPERDWLDGALRARGVEPLLVPTRGSFDARYLARLCMVARRHGVRLIQTHLLSTSVYGSLVGRALGIPVVSTFHGTVDVAEDEAYRAAKLKIIDRRANRMVFVSESLREHFLAAHPLRRAHSQVIHNGIDADRFRPGRDDALRRELGIADDAVLVGSVGNVRTAKAYPVLLRAAARLRDRVRSVHFAIVGQGDGSLLDELIRLRGELGLDEVVSFVGFREDIPRIMRSFDVYLISSSAEGFSLSTVQALASGLPVVATRCGGPEEILQDGAGGLLVERNSPAALADALHRLIIDRGERERLAASARSLVERRFTLDAMVTGYEALYARSLDRSARRVGRTGVAAGEGSAL